MTSSSPANPIRRTLPWLPLALALAGCSGQDDPSPPTGFPAPVVAGTDATDAYADAPARCGMPAYGWQRGDVPLGRVVATERVATYRAAILQALASELADGLPELRFDVESHVVTYTTQDRGTLVDATTLVAWPLAVDPAETASLPTLLLLHGTSGFTDGCGPSVDNEGQLLVAAIAAAGYLVVAPDYIGLKTTTPATGFPHPYLVGEATAIASLDAVRTLPEVQGRITEPGAVEPSSRVVVVGGSQGGHAALWVDRLAPYYARELTIAGVAATVPPADLIGQAELALTTPRNATGNLIAHFGAAASWYGLDDELDDAFVPPFDVDVPTALAASCDPDDGVNIPDTLEALFQPALLEAQDEGRLASFDPWGCMLRENGLTTTSTPRLGSDLDEPSYGILFVTGEADDLVDTPTERDAFATLCEDGDIPLTYLECAGASHTGATAWALPEILAFVAARAAGEPFTRDCAVPPPTRCLGTPADE